MTCRTARRAVMIRGALFFWDRRVSTRDHDFHDVFGEMPHLRELKCCNCRKNPEDKQNDSHPRSYRATPRRTSRIRGHAVARLSLAQSAGEREACLNRESC